MERILQQSKMVSLRNKSKEPCKSLDIRGRGLIKPSDGVRAEMVPALYINSKRIVLIKY